MDKNEEGENCTETVPSVPTGIKRGGATPRASSEF